MTDTWDPIFNSTNITYSGGNQTATGGSAGTYNRLRSLTSKSSGKLYFEVDASTFGTDDPGAVIFGVGDGSAATGNQYLGDTLDSVGFQITYDGGGPNHGNIIFNNANNHQTASGTNTTGWVGVAVDIPNLLIWFTTDGTNYNSGGTPGSSGGFSLSGMTTPVYMMAVVDRGGGVRTINSSSPFQYSIPSGFTAWTVGVAQTRRVSWGALEIDEEQPWRPRHLSTPSVAPAAWVPIHTFVMKFASLLTEEDPAPLVDLPWFLVHKFKPPPIPPHPLNRMTVIPPPGQLLVDADGYIKHDWWRFLQLLGLKLNQ